MPTLPTDKELIKEFTKDAAPFYFANLENIITQYENFRKSKEASVSKELEYEILSYSGDRRCQYRIHSVKRLEDNVAFKIGDKLGEGIIVKIEVDNTWDCGIVFTCDNNNKVSLYSAELSKVALFKTYDNFEVWGHNCTIYVVNTAWALFSKSALWCIEHNEENKDCFKFFASEQAAKEYINLNKPMYTLESIKIYLQQSCYKTDFIDKVINGLKLNQ